MNKTKIDWCDSTWNPVTGCLHGCEYCYARGITERFGGHQDLDYFMKTEENPELKEQKLHVLDAPLAKYGPEARAAAYPFYFEPTLYRYKLDEYQKKKRTRNIFVCSMADLFGKWVPDSWIEEVFKACKKASQHNYLFCSKNPNRYIELLLKDLLPELGNMWYGMTVTNYQQAYEAEAVIQDMPSDAGAFLSIEPILEDISSDLEIIIANFTDWVIIGAETGRRKDMVVPKREWIEKIISQCKQFHIPVFMKDSLKEIWKEPLIKEFPKKLQKGRDEK